MLHKHRLAEKESFAVDAASMMIERNEYIHVHGSVACVQIVVICVKYITTRIPLHT